MQVRRSSLPNRIQRKAAQHLEDIRNSSLTRFGERAKLSEKVVEIYRPDVDGVAYYEFSIDLQIDAPRILHNRRVGYARRVTPIPDILRQKGFSFSRASSEREQENGPHEQPTTGFIIISTGPHDFPMPHWSLEKKPPSERLEAAANGRVMSRIYRVDSLSYVAENERGEAVAFIGEYPVLPTRLPPLDQSRMQDHVVQAINNDDGEDTERFRGDFRVRSSGPEVPEYGLRETESWDQLKRQYGSALKPFLDSLRESAQEAWRIEQMVEKNGEGIMTGTTQRIALLGTPASVTLDGPGSRIVDAEIVDDGVHPPHIELAIPPSVDQMPHVHSSREAFLKGRGFGHARIDYTDYLPKLYEPLDIEIRIEYQELETERLNLFVISNDTPIEQEDDFIDEGDQT